jgi:hypothetical protein
MVSALAAILAQVETTTPLAEPPVAGNEPDTLLGELERVRGYIAWKCGGLDSAGLRATLCGTRRRRTAPSNCCGLAYLR